MALLSIAFALGLPYQSRAAGKVVNIYAPDILIDPADAPENSPDQPLLSTSTPIKKDGAVEIFPLVSSGSFTEGSTFEIPIGINTRGNKINTIQLDLSFNPQYLSVVKPSAGISILNLWLETPTYDNTKGTMRLTGFVKNGVTTSSGIITTLTFKALKQGSTRVTLGKNTHVLLNDGVGTEISVRKASGAYTILQRPPGAVTVYSDTHPISDHWYNNNNPSFYWDPEPNATGYSFTLDDKPNTVPDNSITSSSTSFAFQNVADGISYFHIKPLKGKAWGETTHFALRIDGTEPADFTPTVAILDKNGTKATQLTFFTTDGLSGFDHFEIGITDASEINQHPLFVQVESPFVLNVNVPKRVTIRAFDNAGNARDKTVYLEPHSDLLAWLISNPLTPAFLLLLVIAFAFIFNYLVTHHLIRHTRMAWRLLRGTPVVDKAQEGTSTPAPIPVVNLKGTAVAPVTEEAPNSEVPPPLPPMVR